MEQEILKGNQVIAKFMGKKVIDNNCELCGNDVTKEYLCTGNKLGFTRSHALGGIVITLKYNLSWNWLMPVVERIEAIKGVQVHIKGNSVDIFWFGFSKAKGIPENKKYSTWTAVVEFIKWYNANCQTVGPTGDGCVAMGKI